MNLRTRIGLSVFFVVFTTTLAALIAVYFVTRSELHEEVDEFLGNRAQQISAVSDIFALIADKEEPGFEYKSGLEAYKPYTKVLPPSKVEHATMGEPVSPPGFDSKFDIDWDYAPALILSPFDTFPLDFDAVVQVIDEMAYPVLGSEIILPVEQADHHIATTTKSKPQYRTVRVDEREYRMLTRPLPYGGAVQVARDLDETNRALRDLLLLSIFIGATVAVISGAGAWMLARRITKPIGQLTQAAERVAATQDLATPIKVKRKDEVGSLARSFNAMLETLRLSRRQQKQLVADAGHELRTPLTSVRANVDLMKRAERLGPEEKGQILDDTSKELRQLSKLVEELLELAGGDGNGDGMNEPLGEVSLADLAEEAADRARRRTNREVEVEVLSTDVLEGRAEALSRAIDNLIQNALKFSPENSSVRVIVDGRRLEVRDEGQGIPVEDIPHVFDRFYRSVETKSLSGSGLGLAIVKQVVEKHGGRVWAENAEGGGAVVGFGIGG